ncbi:uncharacterized protein LOC133927978 [Phragmites australis]|uniref:uncharacterized protein LOC133927978 n=1 Tax=Phragmites australis TaxID=29695 RepID=UPI002D771596|nr:uncharacterized protein LOC133927978 [Phragmites australis]
MALVRGDDSGSTTLMALDEKWSSSMDQLGRVVSDMQGMMQQITTSQVVTDAWRPGMEMKVIDLQVSVADLRVKIDELLLKSSNSFSKKLNCEASDPTHLGSSSFMEALGSGHRSAHAHRRTGDGKKDQDLRRSFSECVHNDSKDYQLIAAAAGSDVEETVRCACCSVPEDCTAAYIRGVRAAHCGSWVCGLCAEVVGERLRREPGAGVEAALRSHTAVCRDFNATTRLNPKLSLAGSMRDIARRSFNRRASSATTFHDELRAAKTMERTVSCQARFFA